MPTSPIDVRAFRGIAGLAAACLVAVAAAGCGGDSAPSSPDTSPVGATASPVATTSAPGPSASASPASPLASDSASPTGKGDQTDVALRAIRTAEQEVKGAVFDLEDDTERGQRAWSAKVATPEGRQFDVEVAQDGGAVIRKDEDKTPDDDADKLRSAKVGLDDAIRTAAGRADGKGSLSAVEIDTARGSTVWQIQFGGDDGTTVLVDASSGKVLAVGPDVG